MDSRTESILEPILRLIPFELSMPQLVGSAEISAQVVEAVESVSRINPVPAIEAGLWLYVGDLERSHAISQSLETPIGSYWHAIMHRREGDFWNSKYWLRRAQTITLDIEGYNPADFVDAVEFDAGNNRPELVDRQRSEWMALFAVSVGKDVVTR